MKELYFKEKIYYRVNSFEAHRSTLIFVHGVSGSSSAWKNYEEALKDKYNILTFDLRGHGKSKKFPKYNDYRIENFVSDLEELLDFLQIEKFILVSHSYATLIAWEYINLHSEKIISNIFLSPIMGAEKRPISKILNFILTFSKIFEILPFKVHFGQHIDYSKYKNSTDWSPARCYADVANTDLRVYLYCLKHSLLDKDYPMDKINMPTLIVHGEKDTIIPVENSISLSKKIKNVRLEIIPNTDHIIVLNNSREILEIFYSFLK